MRLFENPSLILSFTFPLCHSFILSHSQVFLSSSTSPFHRFPSLVHTSLSRSFLCTHLLIPFSSFVHPPFPFLGFSFSPYLCSIPFPLTLSPATHTVLPWRMGRKSQTICPSVCVSGGGRDGAHIRECPKRVRSRSFIKPPLISSYFRSFYRSRFYFSFGFFFLAQALAFLSSQTLVFKMQFSAL